MPDQGDALSAGAPADSIRQQREQWLREREALLDVREIMLDVRDALLRERETLLGIREAMLDARDARLCERETLLDAREIMLAGWNRWLPRHRRADQPLCCGDPRRGRHHATRRGAGAAVVCRR